MNFVLPASSRRTCEILLRCWLTHKLEFLDVVGVHATTSRDRVLVHLASDAEQVTSSLEENRDFGTRMIDLECLRH